MGKSNAHKGRKHSPEWNAAVSAAMKGKVAHSKISKDLARAIRRAYERQEPLPPAMMGLIGKNGPNGILVSYKTMFCKHYAQEHQMTPAGIRRIIDGKVWKD